MVKKLVAYEHIQKSMLNSFQEKVMTTAFLIKKKGQRYEVTRTAAIADNLTWDIHESNVLAIFREDHKIWKYLYE